MRSRSRGRWITPIRAGSGEAKVGREKLLNVTAIALRAVGDEDFVGLDPVARLAAALRSRIGDRSRRGREGSPRRGDYFFMAAAALAFVACWAVTSCCFLLLASLALLCFCAAFFCVDFGDLSPMAGVPFNRVVSRAECSFPRKCNPLSPGKPVLQTTIVPYFSAAAMRSRAVTTFSRLLNELMRTWPSPHRPKPAPGVQTTPARMSSRSKNSHESRPTLTQM